MNLLDDKALAELISATRNVDANAQMYELVLGRFPTNPLSRTLRRALERVCRHLEVMTTEEYRRFLETLPPVARFMLGRGDVDPTAKLTHERLALEYLRYVVLENDHSAKEVIESDSASTPVLRKWPELSRALDDDGLLGLTSGMHIRDSGIEYEGHLLYWHQFLRCGYKGRINLDFVAPFLRYFERSNHENAFRVAVDLHRICAPDDCMQVVTKEGWFGPRFTLTSLDDPRAVGLTTKARFAPHLFDLLYGELRFTDFYWSLRDGVKSLQIEEVCGPKASVDGYHINRYVHARRDLRAQRLTHFDGSVKVYAPEALEGRLGTHIPKESPSTKYIKLFRIDGSIEPRIWMELMGAFYQRNELIVEYFDEEQYECIYGERLRRYRAS